jgi:hypothetical protein
LRARPLGNKGAVYVEFLAVFIPIFFSFWLLLQSAGLYGAKLVTMHAAYLGARAAAVVLPDDPAKYDTGVGETGGKRTAAIKSAVHMGLTANSSLLWPLAEIEILGANGNAKSKFGREEVVKVRVTVPYVCTLPVADKVMCGLGGISYIKSESSAVIQGADYVYP